MNLAAVMDQVAARLDTIDTMRSYAYPPDSLTPPSGAGGVGVVSYPDTIAFDGTYGRGSDSMRLPVVLIAGKVSDRTARDVLGAFCDGSGAKSVKTVLESGSYTAFHTLTVVGIGFDTIAIAGVDYLAAVCDLDIVGSGSA